MRAALTEFRASGSAHTGLALHRLLPAQTGREFDYAAHVDEIARMGTPPAYAEAYARWLETLAELGTVHDTFAAAGPLAIGLGGTSPIDVGIALHHTFATPLLPGAALKGLASRAALHTDLPEADRRTILGSERPASAGYATFWDGWLVPDGPPLRRDVITVHHADYYASRGRRPPTDFDDPNPIAFLSIRPGSRFTVAVSCPESAELAEVAMTLIAWGLEHLGIGGKTNAGYGRLRRDLP